ncbi:MAG: hypothetical protein ACLGHL_05425 [Actinomycetota bacterium]
MAIETTLTVATFLLIVGASIVLRLIVMVPYRLVRKTTAKEGYATGWPEPARARVLFKGAGSSIARFVTSTLVPLFVFVVASLFEALRLIARSFASGVVVLSRWVTSTGARLLPLLDSLGERVTLMLTDDVRAPRSVYSLVSPAAMFEDALWRAVAGDSERGTGATIMESLRHRRVNPVLQPLLVARRQTI